MPYSGLGEREIHLWHAALDVAAETLSSMGSLLSEDERERAGRFRFERDRRRFVAARAWLRILLGRYVGQPGDALPFAYGVKGKPYLKGGPHFSVSHSGELALFAFCGGEEVGVDVEAVREIDDAEGIVRSHFTPAERKRWMATASALRARAFFDGWTRQEAIGKALGEGLALMESPAGEAWSILSLNPAPGYAAALAVRGAGWHIRDMGQCGGWQPQP